MADRFNKETAACITVFSIDTARNLVKMDEYYPGLMERITRREPNAYLAALYWDSSIVWQEHTGQEGK